MKSAIYCNDAFVNSLFSAIFNLKSTKFSHFSIGYNKSNKYYLLKLRIILLK